MGRLDPIRRLPRRAALAARYGWEGLGALADRCVSPQPPADRLVIFDDIFPLPLSPFRIAEYNAYLAAFPRAQVFSSGASFALLGRPPSFRSAVADYARRNPSLAGRVAKYHPLKDLRGRAAYTVFLNNASFFLRDIERNKLPFAFTLYPGGGFALDHAASDAKLRRVCSSPCFRKVIATQPATQDYLARRGFCDPAAVEMIFGLPLPVEVLTQGAPARRRMGREKDTFDVCFVAFKYVRGGLDKGYDLFVEAARTLAARVPPARFHVVGPFGPSDADVTALGDRIRFHGTRRTEFFPGFYADMDVILSPGDASARSAGDFDGFPLGACIEAGLCGTAVFAADPLGQNRYFKDGEELVVVPRSADAIADRIEHYCRRYEDLGRLAEAGRRAFMDRYGRAAQIEPRLRIVSELLGLPPASGPAS